MAIKYTILIHPNKLFAQHFALAFRGSDNDSGMVNSVAAIYLVNKLTFCVQVKLLLPSGNNSLASPAFQSFISFLKARNHSPIMPNKKLVSRPSVEQFNPFDNQQVLKEVTKLLKDEQFDLEKPNNAAVLSFLHHYGIQHYWVAAHTLKHPLVITGLFATNAIEEMYHTRQSNPAFCDDFEAYIKDWLP